MTTTLPGQDTDALLTGLGIDSSLLRGGELEVRTPITGEVIANLHSTTEAEAEAAIARSVEAFQVWRDVPAPRRGELVRLLADELRQEKEALGALVTLEAGKIGQEGLGEVQEMIDICDFAVGLSRQLYGLTIASERPGHRMMETWLPLGPVGIITAFNFPVAVWSWNAALALVCGDPVIWKPSSRTPLTALACQALFRRAVERFGDAPEGLVEVIVGSAGRALVDDPRVPLVSATGSTAMGQALAPRVADGHWYGTTGVGPDLYIGAQEAVRAMVDHLAAEHGLSPEDAYLLCSLCVDLRISEIVDAGEYVVSALLPLQIFAGA